jgi:uncharacterized protein (UPF0276 family)
MDVPSGTPSSVARPIPRAVGIGLRAPHYRDVLQRRPNIGWFEVHSENYFGDGGPPLYYLEQIRAEYPISLHGVGLSLGSTDPLNTAHLEKLRMLIKRFEPALVSEHLSWGSVGGRYLNDLIPVPYSEHVVVHMADRVAKAQDYLGRQILIENVSSYLEYDESSMPEWEFVAEVARRAGCGILLDVNNVYVNSVNHRFDARQYLDAIPTEAVQEFHLAGFTTKSFSDGQLLIDTHNQLVADEVWDLYRFAVRRFSIVPTLIEWDTDLPALDVLLHEMDKAAGILEEHGEFAT